MSTIYLALLALAGQADSSGAKTGTTTPVTTVVMAPAPTGAVSSAARAPDVLAGPSIGALLKPITKDQAFIDLTNSLAARSQPLTVKIAPFQRDAAADARTAQLRPQDNLPQTDPDVQLAALHALALTPKTGGR